MQNHKLKLLFFLVIFFVLPDFANAYTGNSLTPITLKLGTNIVSTQHITGGHYVAPLQLTTSNTEYILDGDIVADGSAIQIQANYVVINLNGHTVTYSAQSAGYGISPIDYNNHDWAVTNGQIIQAPSYSRLTTNIDSTQTSIEVTDSSVYNIGDVLLVHSYNITAGNVAVIENIYISNIVGNQLTVIRGYGGTIPFDHVSGLYLYAKRASGSLYGAGNNPINTKIKVVQNVQIAGVYVKYSGQDVAGMWIGGNDSIVENNIVEDDYPYGPVENRQAVISAITLSGTNSSAVGNTVINARQSGISIGFGSIADNNTISLRSICTNSGGIRADSESVIKNNTITGEGEHTIGIQLGQSFNTPVCTDADPTPCYDADPTAFDPTWIPNTATTPGYTHDIEVFGNNIDLRVTRIGSEYGGSYPGPSALVDSDVADGFRATTGSYNFNFHHNNIVVRSNADYIGTWSLDGRPVRIRTGARGGMIGMRATDQSMYIHDNNISALSDDGVAYAAGLACDANSDNRWIYKAAGWAQPLMADFHPDMRIYDNKITSNNINVALSDSYGGCDGFPLIYSNTLIKSGNFANYHTLSVGYGAYQDVATGIFLSNKYENGAAEDNIDFKFERITDGNSNRSKAIIFGRIMSGTVRDNENNLLPNIHLTVRSITTPSCNTQFTTISNLNGVAPLYVFDYELNNASGTTASVTPLRIDLKPHKINLYNVTTGSNFFDTVNDYSATAWDAINSSGTYLITDLNGSIEISVSSNDVVAPAAPTGLGVA